LSYRNESHSYYTLPWRRFLLTNKKHDNWFATHFRGIYSTMLIGMKIYQCVIWIARVFSLVCQNSNCMMLKCCCHSEFVYKFNIIKYAF
jgi:hypothetical protein